MSNKDRRKWACSKCSQDFLQKSSLSRHNTSGCGKDWNFKCPNCAKEFNRKDSLKRHLVDVCKGVVVKVLVCNICTKDFKTEWHLQRHLPVCLPKCPKCGKKFPQEELDTHQTSCFKLLVKLPSKKVRSTSNQEMEVVYPEKIDDLVDFAMILDYLCCENIGEEYFIDMEVEREEQLVRNKHFSSFLFTFSFHFYIIVDLWCVPGSPNETIQSHVS